MDPRVYDVLEFDKVKSMIEQYAACSLGRQRIAMAEVLPTMDAAQAELAAVDEALQFLFRHGTPPFGGITDIRPQLRKAAIGGVLSADELNRLGDFIAGTRRLRQAIASAAESGELQRLVKRAEELYDARQTETEIRQAVSEDATIHDHASPELRSLRTARRQGEAHIRRQLEQLLRTHQRYLQDPVITMRGNSYCLPVRVEYKNMVPGVVHDYSASGATVFVEPQAVVELAARLRALEAEEEREIERILQRLSGVVAGVAEELQRNADIVAEFDAWFAKAEYARRERCERPLLNRSGKWSLHKARHPLIARSEAVPVDLELGTSYRLLIITGPNTGGKTVTLKTVGLLTLLAMAGCFIPAGEGSEIAWCDQIFADIGDEQSIEQSLSTFSSHLRNIVHMFAKVTRDSLVLLDELGAGTDPAEGAALSVAILEHLKACGARVVATTHYAELKAYAFREPLAMNASVEFDVQTLRPTYRLMIGVPGRSNALAIASRLGLPPEIVEQARSFLKTEDLRVEDLIAKMEAARREAEQLRQQAAAEQERAERLRVQLEQERTQLQEEAHRLRERAVQDAQAIVERAQSEVNRVIQELRSQRDRPLKDHQLVALRQSLQSAAPDALPKRRKSGTRADRIDCGAHVRVLSLGQKGEVLERSDDGKEFVVQLGALRLKVGLDDIELVSAPQKPAATQTFRRSPGQTMPLQLDIRGETVEESLPRVDKYLDDAVVHGLARVTIVHGKGTGALRDGIRRYLSRHPHVRSWAPGGPGEGGDGATVVELR